MSNEKKAFKAGVWYTIGNFVVKAASFLTTPIFTRVLTVGEIGDFSNYISWLNILLIVTTIDLYYAINLARFDYKDEIDSFISSILVQGSIITTLIFGIIVAFKTFFLNLFSLTTVELFLIYIYCLVYPAMQMYQLKCRIEYKYIATVILSVSSLLSSTFVSLVLVLSMKNKYFGRYFGYTLPIIIICIFIYLYLIAQGKRINPKKYWKYAFVIAFPMMWHTLAGNILTTSDQVMIRYFCDSNSVGLYAIPYSCASIVQILWISLNSAWSPWALEKINDNDYDSINKAIKPYSIFFAVVVFAVMLISPEVLLFIGGTEYMPALKIMPIIMLAYIFNFSYSFYVNIELFYKKQIYIATCTIIAALINFVLNLILIPKFGYVAAAYTTLIGYISLFVMHYLACVLLKKSKYVINKYIFMFLGVTSLALVIMPLLYKYTMVRYGLIILIVFFSIVFSIFFRKEVLYLVKHKSVSAIINRIRVLRDRG